MLITSNQLVWSIPLYWQLHSQKFAHPGMQFESKEPFLPVFRVTVLFSFCRDRSGICLLQGLDGSGLLPQSPLLCSCCLCPLLHCLQERKSDFCRRTPFKNHTLNSLFITASLKLSIRLMFFRITSL